MFLRQYVKTSTAVAALLSSLLLLSGCQTFSSGGSGCESRGVPTLNENQCLLPTWVNFARESQKADERWRSIVMSHLHDDSVRSQLVRAVTLSWSSQQEQLRQAAQLYRRVDGDVPDALQPLVKLLDRDVADRIAANNQLNYARSSLDTSRQAQAAQMSALQQSNAELKHKLSELANIEASMDQHRTQ